MAAMFNELFRIWAYIIFGLCIMFIIAALAWIAWHYHCARMDRIDEMREGTIDNAKLIRAMQHNQDINRYRGESYYRSTNEREPHGN